MIYAMKTVYVKDFTEFPGPRFTALGPSSGEEFRDSILIPSINEEGGAVAVNLDETMGYGSSFLEEAFGGLIRKGISKEIAIKIGENIVSLEDPSLIDEIKSYIDDEAEKAH